MIETRTPKRDQLNHFLVSELGLMAKGTKDSLAALKAALEGGEILNRKEYEEWLKKKQTP